LLTSISALFSKMKASSRSLTLCLVGLLAPGAAGTDLTPDNWDDAKFGKSVFIKFQAPW
jgi:hypothetical protein